jgi:hypothetical protein
MGPSAARFEVDEQQAVTGAEEVARMWFAVQQLLGSTAAVDPFTSALQRAEEEMPVGLSERGASSGRSRNVLVSARISSSAGNERLF